MRKTMLAAAAVLIGSFGAAAAADLGGYRGPSMKDVGEPAIYPTWGGFYVGGNAGYGWADFSNKDFFEDESTESDSDHGNGFIYGAQVGYNFQRGNIVFGVEASFNGTNMDGNPFGDDTKDEIDWYGTGVGRLGYASGPWLFYGFGGVAWGKVKVKEFGERDDDTLVGWTAGAGIERALGNNFSVRLEYSHVDLGSETFNFSDFDDKVDVSFDAVKLGLNYKFGPREEAPLK